MASDPSVPTVGDNGTGSVGDLTQMIQRVDLNELQNPEQQFQDGRPQSRSGQGMPGKHINKQKRSGPHLPMPEPSRSQHNAPPLPGSSLSAILNSMPPHHHQNNSVWNATALLPSDQFFAPEFLRGASIGEDFGFDTFADPHLFEKVGMPTDFDWFNLQQIPDSYMEL